MNRLAFSAVLSASLLCAGAAFSQVKSQSATATCNFDSTNQVAINYQRVPFDVKKKVLGNEIPYGKIWAPGGKPMTMFTNTALSIGGNDVPVGAYTLFVIPEKEAWTLVVSRSTDTSGKYDEQQDLARITMQFGQLGATERRFSIYFVHAAPNQCNMRLYLQKTGEFVTVTKK